MALDNVLNKGVIMCDDKKKECEYCEKTRKLISDGDGILGFSAVVIGDCLWVSAWLGNKYNGFSKPKKINFCPMCGRELEE